MSITPISAAAQSQLTSRELMALSARDANHVAQRDLLSVFKPVHKYGRGMFLRVRGTGMTTRPYGTEFQGVCRQDALTLWYAPARSATVDGNPDQKPGSDIQDVPLEPYGFDASAWFHIGHLPAGKLAPRSQSPAWQSACDPQQFNDETPWFSAQNARQAVLGANIFRMAEDQVKAGTLSPKPCEGASKTRSCVQAILAVNDLAKLQSVEDCGADSASSCVKLNLNSDTQLIIVAHVDAGDPNGVTPSDIVSIEVSNYVIVT